MEKITSMTSIVFQYNPTLSVGSTEIEQTTNTIFQTTADVDNLMSQNRRINLLSSNCHLI